MENHDRDVSEGGTNFNHIQYTHFPRSQWFLYPTEKDNIRQRLSRSGQERVCVCVPGETSDLWMNQYSKDTGEARG